MIFRETGTDRLSKISDQTSYSLIPQHTVNILRSLPDTFQWSRIPGKLDVFQFINYLRNKSCNSTSGFHIIFGYLSCIKLVYPWHGFLISCIRFISFSLKWHRIIQFGVIDCNVHGIWLRMDRIYGILFRKICLFLMTSLLATTTATFI